MSLLRCTEPAKFHGLYLSPPAGCTETCWQHSMSASFSRVLLQAPALASTQQHQTASCKCAAMRAAGSVDARFAQRQAQHEGLYCSRLYSVHAKHEMCIQLLAAAQMQAFFLVADDIMDGSITRRGQPCWYKQPHVRAFSKHCSAVPGPKELGMQSKTMLFAASNAAIL